MTGDQRVAEAKAKQCILEPRRLTNITTITHDNACNTVVITAAAEALSVLPSQADLARKKIDGIVQIAFFLVESVE